MLGFTIVERNEGSESNSISFNKMTEEVYKELIYSYIRLRDIDNMRKAVELLDSIDDIPESMIGVYNTLRFELGFLEDIDKSLYYGGYKNKNLEGKSEQEMVDAIIEYIESGDIDNARDAYTYFKSLGYSLPVTLKSNNKTLTSTLMDLNKTLNILV